MAALVLFALRDALDGPLWQARAAGGRGGPGERQTVDARGFRPWLAQPHLLGEGTE